MLFIEYRQAAEAGDLEHLPAACEQAVLRACGLRVDQLMMVSPGSLPRTSSGKLRRRETLTRFLAGQLQGPDTMGPLKLAGEMVRSALAYGRAGRAQDTDRAQDTHGAQDIGPDPQGHDG